MITGAGQFLMGSGDEAMDPLMIGRYKVQRRLGQGAMGVVYLAFDPLLMRLVAIKTVRDTQIHNTAVRTRFQRQAVISAQLNHPHIVSVYDVGEDPASGPFLAMEFVEGSSLAELERKGLSLEKGIPLLIQILSALSASEASGIIHRDIRPQNILVSKEGRAKLMDFGLGHDGAEWMAGSADYLAPEILAGFDATPASDRYAFAVVLFELVTGHLPFPPEPSPKAFIQRVLNEPARIPENLPAALRYVFHTALAKRPEDRHACNYAFMEALIQALPIEAPIIRRLLTLLAQFKAIARTSMPVTLKLPDLDPPPPIVFDAAEDFTAELDLNTDGLGIRREARPVPTSVPTSAQTPASIPPMPDMDDDYATHPGLEILPPPTRDHDPSRTTPIPPEPAPKPALELDTFTRAEMDPSDSAPTVVMVPEPPHGQTLPRDPIDWDEPQETRPVVGLQPAPAILPTPLTPPTPALTPTMALAPTHAVPDPAPLPSPTQEPPSIQAQAPEQSPALAQPKKRGSGLILAMAGLGVGALAILGLGAWHFMHRDASRPVATQPMHTLPLITTTPDGARIFLGDRDLGSAPIQDLRYAGDGQILRVECEGYRSEQHILKAKEGPLHISLSKAAEIRIRTEPAGAEVQVDDQIVGKTPLKTAVPEGHEITLRMDGYEEWHTTFDPDLPMPDPVRLSPVLRKRRR